MRQFRILTGATLICIAVSLFPTPSLVAAITEPECYDYAVDQWRACTKLCLPNDDYCLSNCAAAFKREYNNCLKNNGLPPTAKQPPPPPPPKLNVTREASPPNTVGTNPGPNTTTTGPENFFQKFIPTDPCNWAGFYIGFNNGATFNHFHLSKQMTDVDLVEQFYDLVGEFGEGETGFTTFHIPGHSETDTETIGGGQTGFNFAFGHFVIGGEGGFQGNGSSAGGKFHEFQTNELFLRTEQSFVVAETDFRSMRMVETTWNGFVGGHIGFCWNRFLFYGEGGAAFTDAHFLSWQKADTSFFAPECDGDCPGFAPSSRPNVRRSLQPNQDQIGGFIGEIVSKKMHTQGDVLTGWYGGGGVDFKLTNIVSVGLEYKHVDWGDVTEHLMTGPNGGPIFPGNGHLDLNADQVLFKVNLLIGH